MVDELVTTSSFSKEEKARHPHGWLDNDGKNRWERWTTYLQDKNNTVWEASLRIATAADGTKYLYDIDPINEIKKMRGPGIGRNSSDNSLSTSSENVKPFSEKNSGKSQIREDAETDLAKDYAAPITAKDVEELRSIGRKSVSQFTSKDLQKAGKWAYKFYQELGTKSPFFRTWFGDWRANDLTKATVVKGTESEYAGAGKITNKDMNRSVSWGDVLKKETQVHSRKNDTVKFLGDIGNIVENAVLFDTVVSEASSKTKMPNTAFMHSLYSVYKANGETYLLKLYVEEALPNRGGDPFSRAYELKTIEKIANLPNGVLSVSEGLTDGKSAISNLTVADIFSLVKAYDKDFSAGTAVNPMFLNDNGTPKMFYHGSRTGGFTEFRSWQYFSEKKNYAQGYADRNNENSLYAVYLHADKIFDTRDAEARRIFYDIRQEYGLGEVQEDTGLPDWTDGYDLSDYLEEHPELGYDAILLDEGGDMIDGKPVSRGESIVIKSSSQIKSATDNIGTFDRSNPDIRYQYKDSSETNAKASDEKPKFRADYEALIQKPDMAVTRLSPGRLPESRAAVIDLARKNAAEIGHVDKNGGVSVFVADIGEDVYLSKSGLRHSLDRRFAVNAPVIAEAGEILANSIQINELNPRGEAHDTIVLIGAAEGANGEFYLVESVLNRQDMELETMEILYSMNAKKGTAVLNAPPATTPDYRSTITIADLLDVVNTNFPDVLPESVLRHFGHTERPAGRIGESALYQYRDYTSINERRALVAALEASAQTDSEKMALTEYRRNLGYLEQQEQKLVQLRREIRELSFAKGKRDMSQIQSLREEAMLTSNRIDTADKALLRGEKMAPIKRLLQSETAKAALAERQRAAAALREEKQAALKEKRELADRYRERMHRNVEGRKMTETKNKIKRAVSDLRSLMNAGKDRANVKIELRPAVQQALDTADVLFSNMSDAEVFRAGIHPVGEIEINAAKRYGEFLDRVERMQRELEALPEGSEAYSEKAKNLETNRKSLQRNGKILQQAFIRERAALNALPVSSAIQALADAYKDLGESKSPHVAAAYDSTVYEKLLSIKTDLGGTTLQNMSLAQLESVYDAYKLIRKTVRDANRVWREGKWEDVQANGDAVVREVQEVRPQRDSRAAAVGRMNTIVLNELKPYYFFEAVGSQTLSRFYDSLRAGEDTFARDVYETQSFLADVFEQTKAKKWDMDKTFSITLEEGRTVQLSLGEMLSIYAYSKREQALQHMSDGGFMRPGTQVKTGDDVKGKIRDALLPSEDTGRKAFRVKEADVGKIVEALNKADKNYIVYADRMQKFLSEVMGAKGNEASRALYDIDLFKEQYYFPLQSSKDFMTSAATPPGESSLRNSGMTKETTPGAKNPIILQSFNDVWASHVNKMSLYHAFVLPIDAMNKLLNYTDFYQSGEPVSVKTALNASWGRGAYEYIHQLLVDLNGGVTVPGAKSPIGALIGRFKKTAVAANLSVMVQQPTAILRAMTVIDPSSFIPLTGLSHKAKWEQLKKYAPVAVLKEMGGFDVGSGRQLQQYLFGDSSLMAKIDDFTMKGAAFGDEIGWNMIWDAAKRQIHRETGLSYDSEDLLQQAGKLFTKAVHQTQVYDSVLSRSGYMRSQSDLVKMSTSFMAEPTTTVNMLYNAVLQLKRGKMSFQQASRTVAFTFLASIAAAVAQSFVTAARDKDEDKTYYEKLMGDLVGNTLSNTFIPGMLPVLRDVVSLLEGWDVERTDMALVNDLIDAVKTATSDKKSTYDKVEAISGAFANFFGIPLRNIMRDGRAFYNVVRAFFSDTPTTGQGIKESIQSEIPFFGHDASNAESLYNAYASGDRVMRDRVIGRYKDEEAAQTALKSEIRRRYLKGQLDRETALRNLQEFVGENEDEAYWSLDRWDYAKAEGTAEGYDRYEDLHNVIPQGTGTKAVLQTYLDNGVSRQALAAEITRYFKPKYQAMGETERSNIRGKLLNAYEALGYNRQKKLEEIVAWGKEKKE